MTSLHHNIFRQPGQMKLQTYNRFNSWRNRPLDHQITAINRNCKQNSYANTATI